MCDKLRSSRPRLGNFGSSYRERKEAVRQVFLFTNHLLITARTNNGKLRLVKNCGKISLVECTLVEDTTTELFNVDDEGTVQQQSIPCLSPQHRHSTSLCIGTNISNNENDLHDAMTNCFITPICSTDSYSPIINTIDEARAVLVTTVTTMTTTNIITATTMTPTMNSINTSSSSILHGRNNSNVSYSTITSPIITTIITPDINITNSSPLLTSSSSSCIQPTSPLSFSMLHRFSSNMGLFNSINNNNNNNTCINDKTDYGNLDFRLIWEPKNGQPTSIWLVASTLQEKAAWCSDISQCIEQLHYGDILNSAQSDVSSVAMPQSIR
ncbi:unnamed protein product [Schistosoma curassoni]|uniref:PH domain-containing protein n=1 Tax=Schistosoma curassoni TaxID=6186 RepID=A0A183KCD9_9TREM|nr:unnamed protein product [Schistosoma curassoni]